MISISSYLINEQNLDYGQLARLRDEALKRKLAQRNQMMMQGETAPQAVKPPTPVDAPASSSESGLSTVPGPTKVPEQVWNQKFGGGAREQISGDVWGRKFGGGLKKAIEAGIENR